MAKYKLPTYSTMVNIFLYLSAIVLVTISINNFLIRGFNITNPRSLIFVIAPIVLSIVILASTRLGNIVKYNLFHLLIGLLLSICIAEAKLSLAHQNSAYDIKNISKETPHEHVLSKEGINKVHFATKFGLKRKYKQDFFNFGGKSNTETVLCNEAGELITYFSDRYGFNNSDAVWISPNPKIVLLGDSHVHGSCQSKGNTIADLISEKYPNNNIINLAMSGNGPLSNLGTLSEYIEKNEPLEKLIYFHFEGNDLVQDLSAEVNEKKLINYLSGANQDLRNKQNSIDKLVQRYTDDSRNISSSNTKFIKFFKFLRLREFISQKLESKLLKKEVFEQSIKKIKSYCNEKNCEFIYVYIPASESFIDKHKYDEHRNYIFKFLESENIVFLDLYRIFNKNENPLNNWFYLGSHLSDLGAKNTVDELVKKLN
tara:strand:+ start:52 stop:1335 length:1284 start_codon:yes stop_codon:yes gene_type:complete